MTSAIAPQGATSFMRKGRDGWEATYTVPMQGFGAMHMRISTRKTSRGGLYTSVTCFEKGDFFETHKLYDDFSETVEWNRTARCTDKNVSTQQERHVEKVWEYLDKVNSFYAAKQVKDAGVAA